MFSRRKNTMENLDSIIGENMRVIGTITGSGTARIDGTIEGDIDYNGDVVIGETGHVKGNIECDNITLGGKVDGNVNAKEQLNLLASGELIGDVQVSNLIINEHAIFEGNCKMNNVSETIMFEKPKLTNKEKAE